MTYYGTAYPVNNTACNFSLSAGMYNYNGSCPPGSVGSYVCTTVNVIDMSGMVTKRIDCTPMSNIGTAQNSGVMY